MPGRKNAAPRDWAQSDTHPCNDWVQKQLGPHVGIPILVSRDTHCLHNTAAHASIKILSRSPPRK
eukprot:1360076-Prymnesium_polylepis.1